MARTQQSIYDSMTSAYTSTMQSTFDITVNTDIFLPSNWSMYNLIGMMFWVAAGAISVFEQLYDQFTNQTEALIAIAAPQTPLWLQNMALNVFQYDATTPQFIQFSETDIAPYYPTVDVSKRIVTQAAVIPGGFGTTKILVAKGGSTPVPLTTGVGGEKDALQSFFNTLDVPGINVNVISDPADKIYVSGTVNYNAQYAAIIQTNVVAAIKSYLRAIPTTGIISINSPVGLFKLTDLIAAIRAVPGVIDFAPANVNIRKDADTFPPASNNIVNNSLWVLPEWNSGLQGGAGYIVEETTTGYDFLSTLIFTPQ